MVETGVWEDAGELSGLGSGGVGALGLEKYRDFVAGSLCDFGEKKADVNVLCARSF